MQHFYANALTFLRDENGAVTVDWVVLCAALVGLGLAAAYTTKFGVVAASGNINAGLTSAKISLD